MQQILLHTKVHFPRLAPDIIPRPQLLTALDQGLAGAVTLVSAPAGFGKSSLVALWLQHLMAQASPGDAVKVSWLSLDANDNHLIRFLRYLAAAIRISHPDACIAMVAALEVAQLPPLEYLADALSNELAALPGRLILVLDDLHQISDEAIFSLLARLIDYAPPHVHFVLVSRMDPSLPLARWRARGQLHEIRVGDLRFTVDETTTYLNHSLGQRIQGTVAAALHEQTEGWAVGLRLAVLSLAEQRDHTAFLTNLAANRNRYTMDYLLDEVLRSQPAAIQHFLLCTSILGRFCAALCAVVEGEMSEAAAQTNLDYMVRANLFLIDLSSPPHWYRYHHQFQILLQSRLYESFDEGAIAALHHRAGAWFSAQGGIDEALHHYQTISDFAAAAMVIEAARWLAALNEQRYTDLERWLVQIPAGVLAQRPLLLLTQAWVDRFRLKIERCVAGARAAELLLGTLPAEMLPREMLPIVQAETDIVLARFAEDLSADRRLVLAQRAWAAIQGRLDQVHGVMLYFLAVSYQRAGQAQKGLDLLAVALESPAGWMPGAEALMLVARGLINNMDGRLAQAEPAYRQCLQIVRQHNLLYSAAWANYGLGAIAYARNELALAEQHHLAVLRDPIAINYRIAIQSVFNLISIYAAQGRPEQAEPWLEQLRTYGNATAFSYVLEEVAALEARLALVRGDLETALRWAQAAPRELYMLADCRPFVQAEILLAAGAPPYWQAAAQILQKLHADHAHMHDLHGLVSVLVLQALALANLDQQAQALTVLGEALQIAVPNERIRPFLERGAPMARLLHELGRVPQHAQLVERLLAAFPAAELQPLFTRQPLPNAADLVGPLSERELTVLSLMAMSLTNQEIAVKLVVSVHTVRNHIVHIFSKLGVANRRQAVAVARSLGLLPPI